MFIVDIKTINNFNFRMISLMNN